MLLMLEAVQRLIATVPTNAHRTGSVLLYHSPGSPLLTVPELQAEVLLRRDGSLEVLHVEKDQTRDGDRLCETEVGGVRIRVLQDHCLGRGQLLHAVELRISLRQESLRNLAPLQLWWRTPEEDHVAHLRRDLGDAVALGLGVLVLELGL